MGMKHRLHNLGLPQNVVDAANTHQEMPAAIRPVIMETMKGLKQQHQAIQRELSYEYNHGLNRYAVEDLEEQLRPIVAKIRACHGLLSAMRKIPANVLARVFQFYLTPGGERYGRDTSSYIYASYSDEEDDCDDVEDKRPRLGLLCLVCKYWNTVATSTPALWTNSTFTINAQEQKPGKHPLVKSSHAHGISVWMDRVASRPWSLVLNAYGRREMWGSRRDTENAVKLSTLLKGPALQQLQRVFIKTDPMALGMGELTLPKVTSIVVCSDILDDPVRNKKPVLPDLPSLPSLTHAVFEDVLPPREIPLHIPWSQLTHLFIGETIPTRKWQAILKRCTSLQKGCFDLFNYDPHDPDDKVVYPQPDTATLAHLTELVCTQVSPFGEDPLEGVNMPSLTTLKLFLAKTHNCFWDSELEVPNQFSSLKHLTLVIGSLPGSLAIMIVDTVPQLQELFISISSEYGKFVDHLTFQPGKFNMPHLRALGLYIKTKKEGFGQVDSDDEDWEYDDDSDDDSDDEATEPLLPCRELCAFSQSRTKAIQDNEFTSAQPLTQLRQLVVHASEIRQQSHPAIELLENCLRSAVSHGLNAFAFSSWPRNRPSGMQRMGGKPPSYFGKYKHWDEGFMEVVDGIEEYSLYPKGKPLEGW